MRMQDLFTHTHRGLWLRQLADPVAGRHAASPTPVVPPPLSRRQTAQPRAVVQGLTLSPPGRLGGV